MTSSHKVWSIIWCSISRQILPNVARIHEFFKFKLSIACLGVHGSKLGQCTKDLPLHLLVILGQHVSFGTHTVVPSFRVIANVLTQGILLHTFINIFKKWERYSRKSSWWCFSMGIARRGGVEVAGWTLDRTIRVPFPDYPHRVWALWRQGGKRRLRTSRCPCRCRLDTLKTPSCP